MVTLLGALILAFVGVVLRLLHVETTSQLLWFLGIVAFLWCAVQLSLQLRPRRQQGRVEAVSIDPHDLQTPVITGKPKPRSLIERFFPGASLSSGIYNRKSRHAWDENENLPPSYND
ncbi:MAG: hypothetical protein NVS2B12_14420 [Ktedonobacteraceae bacterium]